MPATPSSPQNPLPSPPPPPPVRPSFQEAVRFWLKLGFISFGGPAGQIAIMHKELVEKRRWISNDRFLHALNYCMLLPGPEAQQLATYAGWLLHQTKGGLAAGVLFFLPSMAILWILSVVYVNHGHVEWVAALFHGLKAAVVAIVAEAVIRIGKTALRNEVMWALAAASFIAIYVFHAPFPLIVLGAALIGLAGGKWRPDKFHALRMPHPTQTSGERTVIPDETHPPDAANPSWARAFKVIGIALILWWGPILLVGLLFGWNHTLFQAGLFFSKAALVTFGGAYAVLPYVSQQAVDNYQWLSAGQMLDGLGLAETTPGPLIMVLQFVGFLAGWNFPEPLPPLAAATLGAIITTWSTFAPCFLWIFLGAPHIELLRGNASLTAALSTVTAAVVGVMLNLAVWFGLHVLFPFSEGARVDYFAVALAAISFIGLLKWNWGVVPVILGAGAAGVLARLF